MRMDTEHIEYTKETYEKYIYGSAEVIGLMCLSVFCKSDRVLEQRLALGARALGAAFQKVNFLRDISADVADRKRIYFPGVHILPLTMVQKRTIEIDIEKDFEQAHEYVRNLPMRARKAVAIAYALYDYLFKKIKRAQPEQLGKRIRVPAIIKVVIILRVTFFGK
jgi:phytoene/squalene synthetase